MSDLTRFRDYCRTQAKVDGPTASLAERALWAQLADEIDAYLTGPDEQVDLFGEISEEPASEKICENCGDDLAAEGYAYCTDCLERLSEDERARNDPVSD